MTLCGVGLGPGEPDLLTLRGREVLEEASVVYVPGRIARSIATEHVPADRVSDLEFPMTTDEDELEAAWRDAAATVAPRAREGTAAFVTLGDPTVYSTFTHLRRAIETEYPGIQIEVVPGVSVATAFATAMGVEIDDPAGLAVREATDGAAPIGPDRLLLFKITDAPATHEELVAAGYDVIYGRRLFMEDGETVVTDDPAAVADRDYYTLAYADRVDGADDDGPSAMEVTDE